MFKTTHEATKPFSGFVSAGAKSFPDDKAVKICKSFVSLLMVDNVDLICRSEEEQRMLRELIDASRCAFGSDTDTGKKSSPTKKNETSRKTHRIPASSKYPMYDQIIADQEKRFVFAIRTTNSVPIIVRPIPEANWSN